ncbi:MAG: hypothetical protein ABIO99_03145 [Candidatus Limnocylindria bacterium]
MRGIPSLLAAALAGVAAVVANQDGDADIVPFFVALTLVGGIHAWAVVTPETRAHRSVAYGVAGVWTVAAVWIGVLLLTFQVACGCIGPERPPEETYFGLTATVYHLIGLYGGLGMVLLGTASIRREPNQARA